MDSKMLSTSPSFSPHLSPSIHSHHRFDSLLTYISTFITDLSLNVLDLKQAVYDIMGIVIKPRDAKKFNECECDSCEVEYMMKKCRNVREDIVRIGGLLRGLGRGKNLAQYLMDQPVDQMQAQSHIFPPLNDASPFLALKELQKTHNDLSIKKDSIGFLTFRQIKKSPLESFSARQGAQTHNPFQIRKEAALQMQQKSQSSTQIDEYMNRSLELIRLIREEMRKKGETDGQVLQAQREEEFQSDYFSCHSHLSSLYPHNNQ